MSQQPYFIPTHLLDEIEGNPENLPLTDSQKQHLLDRQAAILRANNEFVATIKPPDLSESDDSDDDMMCSDSDD